VKKMRSPGFEPGLLANLAFFLLESCLEG